MDLTDSLLQLSYSPAINVYLAWGLGMYVIYALHKLTSKSVNELTDQQKEQYKAWIKDGEWNKTLVGIMQILAIPFIGMINDLIFLMIGGPQIVVYSKLWWGQFLPLSTILEFVS